MLRILFFSLVIFSWSFTPGIENRVKLDGIIDKTEWAGAKEYDLSAGGKLYVLRNGNELYIGIKSTIEGWAHVYIHRNDAVQVLHASAALGKQLYTKTSGIWKLQQKFNWELRDVLYNADLQEKQEKYFKERGWVANNNRMGDKGSFEYRINIEGVGNLSFAALVTADAKSISFYPAGLKDDTLFKELVSGNNPDSLQFRPLTWAKPAE